MTKRKSDIKENNHKKRQRKNANKNKKHQVQQEKITIMKTIARQEIVEAIRTFPAPGTSRQHQSELETPATYLQHRLRNLAQDSVDNFFQKHEKKSEGDGSITPQASYDF